MFARCAPRLGTMDLWLDAGRDPFGNLLLHDKDICDLAVVTFPEQVVSVAPSMSCAVMRT
jgi:hypothetical protein